MEIGGGGKGKTKEEEAGMKSQLEKSGRAIEQEEKKTKGKRRIGRRLEEVQERTGKTKSASLATLEPR